MQGVFSNANDIYRFLMMFPHMSPYCKLVPVQYREYEYDLLPNPSPPHPSKIYDFLSSFFLVG